MQLNELKDSDLEQYRALSSVLAQGKFDLQGSAIIKVASLIQWYTQLGPKLQAAVTQQKLAAAKEASKRSQKNDLGGK